MHRFYVNLREDSLLDSHILLSMSFSAIQLTRTAVVLLALVVLTIEVVVT